MNITRRDTLAGAIALLCGLAAEAEARGAAAGQPNRSGFGEKPEPNRSKDRPLHGAPRDGSSGEAPAGRRRDEEAQGGERADVGLVFKHDLPNLTMDDWEVTVSQVDFAPGRTGKVHHHAGFVLAYVLEGNIVSKVSGQEEKTYKPGEMFFEPPGSTHEVSNNASATQPAKLLALIFAKKGTQLTMMGPA